MNEHNCSSPAYAPSNFTYLSIEGFDVEYEGVELLKTRGAIPSGPVDLREPVLFFAVLAARRVPVLWAATGGLVVCIAAELT